MKNTWLLLESYREQMKLITKLRVVLKRQHQVLLSVASESFSDKNEKIIMAQGELVSTNLFQLYMEEVDGESVLLSALDFMYIDQFGEPNLR